MTILEKLKDQTAQPHQELENSPLLQMLVSNQITTEAYRQILMKFYGFFAPLERSLASFSAELELHLPDFAERRKSVSLLHDIQALSGHEKNDLELVICTQLPELKTLHQAFGCIYVLEGSTLGGKVISKHLGSILNIDATTGASFFNGYGAKTGEYWASFRKGLLSYPFPDPEAENTVIATATSTFTSFKNWLSGQDE